MGTDASDPGPKDSWLDEAIDFWALSTVGPWALRIVMIRTPRPEFDGAFASGLGAWVS